MKKRAKACTYSGCKEAAHIKDSFCSFHAKKVTISRFLASLYTTMNRRVKGMNTKRPDIYLGKPILPRDVFMNWSKNHPEFLRLYKRWVNCDFDRKLTPTVNRINSAKGYTLDNIEWMTNSQNCGLSSTVRRLKGKKEIYELLGVNNVKK